MNLIKLNQNIMETLYLQEMVLPAKSGECINTKKENIYCILDGINFMIERYLNGNKDKCYIPKIETKTIKIPYNNKRKRLPISIVYGTETLGIKHIFEQRMFDHLKQDNCEKLSQQQVIDYLKLFPKALESNNTIIDFDKNDEIKYDTILILYEKIFYCLGLQISENSMTYLHTMFKPTKQYLNRIFRLNSIHKIENNLINKK